MDYEQVDQFMVCHNITELLIITLLLLGMLVIGVIAVFIVCSWSAH